MTKAGWMARLLRDRRGQAVLMVALMGVPLVGLAGVAVDGARAVMVRARLATAADAAALAGGRSLEAGTAEADARRYFWANIPRTYLGTEIPEPQIILGDNNETIEVRASAALPTTFTRVLGFTSIPLGTANKARRTSGGLEVALVLDITGSMEGTKIAALRTAATSLVNILFDANKTPNALWISVVPYVASVNLGAAHGTWLTGDSPKGADYGGQGWQGCVEARPYPYDQTDDPPSLQPFRAYFWKSERNNQWPLIKKNQGPNRDCGAPVLPLTNDQNALLAKIKDLKTADGGTMSNLGLQAGWFTLSPRWRGLWGGATPAGLPVDYEKDGIEKAVVLMTDGMNRFDSSKYTAYGFITEKRLGTRDEGPAKVVLNNRMEAICGAIKDAGVKVYTVTLELPADDMTTRSLYQRCASDNASYFDSPTAADLDRVFRTIASRLSRLRLES